MKRVVQRKAVLGLGVAFAVLIIIGINAYRTLSKLRVSDTWVNHTFQVKNDLSNLLVFLNRSLNWQRDYLLTGERLYLDRYRDISKRIQPLVQDLRQLTTDNPTQQQHLDELGPLLSAKLDELRQVITLRQTQGFDAARQVALSERSRLVLDQIHRVVGEMDLEENRLLSQRNQEKQTLTYNTALILIVGSLFSVGAIALAVIALDRDISRRVQAEADLKVLNEELEERITQRTAQLESINRAKDEFLSVLSHELRTPLNAILGWARLLRQGSLNSTKAAQALEVIERNAISQSQLIDDLLDISRIIQGKMRLNVQPLQPIEFIEAAIDTVRPAAEARMIRIQTTLDSSAGPISGDLDRLQQVMWNLLSNAIKFTPKGGRVQVRLERINSHIEITVSDTGQGISLEFLPYVFDRFRQSDSSSTRRLGGLGLGLSIVRQLVEMHGGNIQVDSAGEGQGTTFTIALPLMIIHRRPLSDSLRVHPHTRETTIPLELSVSLTGLQILIVDDEADARELLTTVLEQHGASVVTVASVHEALNAIKHQHPDILISDIGMPDEDGYALIRQVRTLPPEQGGQMPAIAITAYARVEDRIRTLSAGFQMHIPKPIEPAELLTAVANLAQRTGR